jgi:hypothetical protein
MSTTDLTPRQYSVLADHAAAGSPLAVAALAAGVLPPVAEAAVRAAPWFGAVVEASRELQAMSQPDWLERVRRLMRGVIERAVAEERVSLLHLAARQIDAMAPEKFTRDDERRGVEALLHAMSTMTVEQLHEWQSLSRRGPAANPAPAPAEAGPSPGAAVPDPPAPPAKSPPARPTMDAVPQPGPSRPGMAPIPSGAFDDLVESECLDPMKTALRERCPWPGAAPGGVTPPDARAGPAAAPSRPAFAGDPLHAPAPAIVPPEFPAPDPWPFAETLMPESLSQAPRPVPPGKIAMPRVVMTKLPRGRPIPDWLAPEPPQRPARPP